MAETSIEWATHVWNPTTGCDRVSAGCDNCYALTLAKRLKGMGATKYQRDGDPKTSGPGFGVAEHKDTLNDPFGWRKPRRVFVNSMSDLFHDQVSERFIAQVFAAMAATPKHTYMILTKRHARMRSLLRKWTPVTGAPPWVHTGPWPLPNVLLGVSVENQQWADIRIPALLETPAAVRFISAEPLLGPVDLSQWLRKEEVCGCSNEPRGRGLPGSRSGRTDDRLAGADLAVSGEARRPVGRGDAADLVCAPQGGEFHRDVPASAGDVRSGSGARDGSPSGVAPSEWVDSGWVDREPQERHENGQPTKELGVSHLAGAGAARAAGAAAGEAGPVRRAERDGEVDHRAGSGDLLTTGGRGVAPCPRCGVRGSRADDLQNRARRASISWLIVGGESGKGARPMSLEWAASIVEQCQNSEVPVFVKQLGTEWAKDTFTGGRSVAAWGDRKGGDWSYWPDDLRVREFPQEVSLHA